MIITTIIDDYPIIDVLLSFLDFNVQQLHHQDDESKIWWILVWIPLTETGRLLRIFGNLLPGVLMCIDVYCCILFVW